MTMRYRDDPFGVMHMLMQYKHDQLAEATRLLAEGGEANKHLARLAQGRADALEHLMHVWANE